MQAVVYSTVSEALEASGDPGEAPRPGHPGEPALTMREVPRPRPGPEEVLVDVRAASLNFGGLAYRDRTRPGGVVGADGAGAVLEDPQSRLAPGTRVAFATPHGTWARHTVVPATNLAVIPHGISDADAAALPGAGLTALQAVRVLEAEGDLADRSVLVTGAAGGVGGYAVQLARRAGARVLALARSADKQEHARVLGAHRAVGDLNRTEETVDAVIDTVGGEVLVAATRMVAPGALVLNVGHASGRPATIDFEELRRRAPGTRVEAFVCTDVSGPSLGTLLSLVAAGELSANVSRVVPWTEYRSAVHDLLYRASTGKTVLMISSPTQGG